jgi:hypothetical protein
MPNDDERTSDRFRAAIANVSQPLEPGNREVSGPRPPGEPGSEGHDNLFQVLSHRARTRTRPELWLTAVFGLLNALLLSWRYPAFSWVAAGCAATGAYGVWGLLDRAARTRMSTEEPCRATIQQLIGLRDLTAVAGTVAALWAVLALTATALGNWVH